MRNENLMSEISAKGSEMWSCHRARMRDARTIRISLRMRSMRSNRNILPSDSLRVPSFPSWTATEKIVSHGMHVNTSMKNQLRRYALAIRLWSCECIEERGEGEVRM